MTYSIGWPYGFVGEVAPYLMAKKAAQKFVPKDPEPAQAAPLQTPRGRKSAAHTHRPRAAIDRKLVGFDRHPLLHPGTPKNPAPEMMVKGGEQ